MKIGIIGAGMIARAFAAIAIKQGHQVMLSNTRSPNTLFSLTGTLGCVAGSPQDAASFGDIVLVAIPFAAYQTLPVSALAGKIVLNANNYYAERDGNMEELDSGESTTSELMARHLPASIIVQAFNAITAADIERHALPPGTPERRALPIAGDDAAAKATVSGLINELGFDVVDAGALSHGRLFDKDTPAYCVRMDATQLQEALTATSLALAM